MCEPTTPGIACVLELGLALSEVNAHTSSHITVGLEYRDPVVGRLVFVGGARDPTDFRVPLTRNVDEANGNLASQPRRQVLGFGTSFDVEAASQAASNYDTIASVHEPEGWLEKRHIKDVSALFFGDWVCKFDLLMCALSLASLRPYGKGIFEDPAHAELYIFQLL